MDGQINGRTDGQSNAYCPLSYGGGGGIIKETVVVQLQDEKNEIITTNVWLLQVQNLHNTAKICFQNSSVLLGGMRMSDCRCCRRAFGRQANARR